MSSAISRLPCFSPVTCDRRLQIGFTTCSCTFGLRPRKVLRVLSNDGNGAQVSNLKNESLTTLHRRCANLPRWQIVTWWSCFGWGIVSLILTGSPTASGPSMLIGGALLALSTLSMKVWRQGKSSLPFILGQAALAIAFLWKNFQPYSLVKSSLQVSQFSPKFCVLSYQVTWILPTTHIFSSGLNAALSAAMLCFYTYVVISGGNPPPKKLKLSATS